MATLAESYRYCESIARRQAGNFYHAFRLLPKTQRLSMCALYAFLRITDDLADGPCAAESKREALQAWRGQLDRALAGEPEHEVHVALLDTVRRHGIPHAYLEDAIIGVEMDLQPTGYDTFDALYTYCYRVASVVGLACIHIWGFTGDEAKPFAEAAGIAFQLTNILRDLGEDVDRGRVYLPQEEMKRYGYTVEQLRRHECTKAFHELMSFQVARVREYYCRSEPLSRHLPPAGRAVFQVMTNTYGALLDDIERRDYDVFTRRVAVSAWRKLGFVLQALPVRWGWV